MKPELILQSDVLDILFENKNKQYGAYELRKYYDRRLLKSICITISLVIILAVLQSWKVPHRKGGFILTGLDSVLLVDVVISKEIIKPKERVRAQPRKVATADYQSILVVKDKLVKDTLLTVEELTNKVISNKTVSGEDVGETEVIVAPAEGNGNKTIIVEEKIEEDNIPMDKVDFMPEYPGGNEAFQKFMQRNLKQPEDMEEHQKVLVMAKFVVNKEGDITDIDIIKNGRKDLDEEVVRVIKKMPKWKPGIQNGRKVSVYFKLPVTFVSEN
jgi:protein TonB